MKRVPIKRKTPLRAKPLALKKRVAKKARKPSRTSLKRKADTLFSLYIRKRDGHCLKCGATTNLQCSHLIRRENLAHRWDPKAAFTLCYKCHICWWHKEPLDANMWIAENFPDMNLYYWDHKEDVQTEAVDYEKLISQLERLLEKGTTNAK